MKRTIAVLLLSAALLAGCSGSTEESSAVQTSEISASSSVQQSSTEQVRTVSSSLSSPLSSDETGEAAKYSIADGKYYHVPVNVISMNTGRAAEEKISRKMAGSRTYSYKKAAEGELWVAVEYEILLDGFVTDERGADASLSAFVCSEDGGMLKKNGKSYMPAVAVMPDEGWFFEGKHRGLAAFPIPDDCDVFILSFGEYGETQAFYRFEMPGKKI